MKNIEKWEDLNNFKNNRGLSLIAQEFDKNVKFFNCYLIDEEDDETCILLGTFYKNNLTNAIKEVYKYGFNVKFEYKEPFNLVEFLRKSLKPKDFNFNEMNFYFASNKNNYIGIFNEEDDETLNCLYFNKEIEDVSCVEEVLNNKRVTVEQLKVALKELGWI